MKSSVDRTLALLRNQRLKTAHQPCFERGYAPGGTARFGARTRALAWPRIGFWVAMGFVVAVLSFFLATGGRKEAPTIAIVTPSHGTSVPAGSIRVSVQASKAVLVGKTGAAGKASGYHLHYYLDVNPPTAPGKPATTAAGTCANTADVSYTWNNVGPGTHVLSVQLVKNDDTPLSPAVTASVTVRAIAPSPASSPSRTSRPLPPTAGS